MSLELAEQSIQLLTCHISNFVIVHHKKTNPNLEKSVTSVFFCHWSLLMPLAPSEQSIQLLISYHQLKTWSLLFKDNQSKSWEKVWANWNCLSLVTSHVVGTSRAEHTTSYMSFMQMKTLSSFTTRQPIQILKKVWPLFFCHWSLIMLLAPAGQSMQLLICHVGRWRLCHRSPQDNQSKSREKVWPLVFFVTGDGVYDTWEQFIAGVHKLGTSSTALKRIKIVPVCEAINSSCRFFSIQIFGVMPPNWNGLLPWWLPLASAEQSIQLFICHTSRLRLCYR